MDLYGVEIEIKRDCNMNMTDEEIKDIKRFGLMSNI